MFQQTRYSEAFKLQVVKELEEGTHSSCNGACQAYGIGSIHTVRRWLEAYGKGHLIKRVMHVETPEERSELKKLKDRVRELEKALCDAHLDLSLSKSYVELACEAAGIEDVEAFKKKHDLKRSTGRGSGSKG